MIHLFFFAAIPPILITIVWRDAPRGVILAGGWPPQKTDGGKR